MSDQIQDPINIASPNVSNTQPSSMSDTGDTSSPASDTTISPSEQGQTSGPTQQPTMVSNPGAPVASVTTPNPTANPHLDHPAVQKADLLHTIAQTLAGGPRWKTTVDPNTGTMTRTKVPLSRGDIGMAIAMEAISGALSGLSVKPGPGNLGRAAGAGFAQEQAERQQADREQEAKAQQDLNNGAAALGRRATAFEQNSRVALNTKMGERYGVESLKDAVNANKQLLADYNDAGEVSETNVSQDALLAGMKSGKYSVTDQIAIPDGFTNIKGHFEQTFTVVRNPTAKVPLTQSMWDSYAQNNVPGYSKDTKIPEGRVMVPGTVVARANAQVQADQLMRQEVGTVVDTLANSEDKNNQILAKSIPSFGTFLSNPQTGPTLQHALNRFQKYVSHSDIHGMDFYESLRQMSQPSKPNPQNPKEFIPNTDAPLANTIAGAFGNNDPNQGWQILKKYHDEITPEQISNEAQAADMIASSEPGSRSYKYAQRWIASNTAQKAAVARAGAEAKASVKAINDVAGAGASGQTDALGFTPNVQAIGGIKEYDKRLNLYKKNLDDLARTEASYQQFASTLQDIASGKNMTGAQSVVGLFNAIGLSATPLAGRGFRITENTIKEHQQARGWGQAVQAKLLGAKDGDIITPQQLRDYAAIAEQARQSQYINLANEMHSAGLSADAALPTGNGQKIDLGTARIFLTLAGNDPHKARQAATAKGWSF